MNPETAQIRRDICADCKRECDVRLTIDHGDPCASCPLRVWHAIGKCEEHGKLNGLGDLVHAVALPIARALRLSCIDPETKKLRAESPCAARRRKLNEAVPFTATPPPSPPTA